MHSVMTREAATVLGVSQRQVTGLLRAGKLDGEQLRDGTWLVTPRSLSERKSLGARSGRSWSSSSSWALLGELSGLAAVGMSQSTRDRIKRRIRTCSAEEIARNVMTRATSHQFTADSLSTTARSLI